MSLRLTEACPGVTLNRAQCSRTVSLPCAAGCADRHAVGYATGTLRGTHATNYRLSTAGDPDCRAMRRGGLRRRPVRRRSRAGRRAQRAEDPGRGRPGPARRHGHVGAGVALARRAHQRLPLLGGRRGLPGAGDGGGRARHRAAAPAAAGQGLLAVRLERGARRAVDRRRTVRSLRHERPAGREDGRGRRHPALPDAGGGRDCRRAGASRTWCCTTRAASAPCPPPWSWMPPATPTWRCCPAARP